MNPLIRRAKAKEPDFENPYIVDHLYRRKNDSDYEAYLDWLDKEGGGLPLEKILTQEEWEFEQKIKENL